MATAAEVIAKLSTYPPDLPVVVVADDRYADEYNLHEEDWHGEKVLVVDCDDVRTPHLDMAKVTGS